jgi:valyl-tRNA synthetase
MVKPRVYRKAPFPNAEVAGAVYTMYRVLRLGVKLLSPVMPFVTDYIWRAMEGRTVARERVTEEELTYTEGRSELMERVVEVNSAIWKWKKERGVRLSEPVRGTLYLPEELAGVVDDVRYLHNVERVVTGVPQSWDYELGRGVYLKIG